MKYKDVFKIWLYADVILLLLLIAAAVISGENINDGGFVLLAMLIGTGLSLPSLVALSCFYLWHNNKVGSSENFVASYIAAIVSINILYFLSSIILFDFDFEEALLYLVTTASGLASFYLVYKQVKRRSTEDA